MSRVFLFVFMIAGSGWSIYAHADVADFIPLGGIVTEVDSTEPLNGTYALSFALYDSKDASAPFWYDEMRSVRFEDGFFTVYLGPIDFLSSITADALWLGIRIGSDVEMERIQIGAIPYASEAQVCHEVVDTYCDDGAFLKGWRDGEAVCERASAGTLHVGPVGDGSNARANGDALQAAVSSIVGATEENPYLIKVEPGVYLLEGDDGSPRSLDMKPWVDIEGSGRNTTIIRSRGVDTREFGTVVLAENSDIRAVTIENIGGGEFAVAVFVGKTRGIGARMGDVSLKGVGATDCRPVYVRYGSLYLEDATVTAHCTHNTFGLFLSRAESVVAKNVDIFTEPSGTVSHRSCGILADSRSTTIRDSDVVAISKGSGDAQGIWAENTRDDRSSELLMMNTTVSASGVDDDSIAFFANVVNDTGGQTIAIHNSSLTATGGYNAAAVRTQWGEPDGTDETHGDTVLEIVGTRLASDGAVAVSEAASATHFVNAFLKGDGVKRTAGTVTCTAVTDEQYAFHGSGCPGGD